MDLVQAVLQYCLCLIRISMMSCCWCAMIHLALLCFGSDTINESWEECKAKKAPLLAKNIVCYIFGVSKLSNVCVCVCHCAVALQLRFWLCKTQCILFKKINYIIEYKSYSTFIQCSWLVYTLLCASVLLCPSSLQCCCTTVNIEVIITCY